MTNKQSWGEEFDRLWGDYPENKYENTKGLDWMVKDFISNLLTSKTEQMEGEIKLLGQSESVEGAIRALSQQVGNPAYGKVLGLQRAIEILKK